jgi:hypothetical protein
MVCREKFFSSSSPPPPPSPVANISVENFLGALFFRKVPLETGTWPARDTVLTNRQAEKLNFDTNYYNNLY